MLLMKIRIRPKLITECIAKIEIYLKFKKRIDTFSSHEDQFAKTAPSTIHNKPVFFIRVSIV